MTYAPCSPDALGDVFAEVDFAVGFVVGAVDNHVYVGIEGVYDSFRRCAVGCCEHSEFVGFVGDGFQLIDVEGGDGVGTMMGCFRR